MLIIPSLFHSYAFSEDDPKKWNDQNEVMVDWEGLE